jgi:two-component system, chemotaxis family, chemotaxis protein CheY
MSPENATTERDDQQMKRNADTASLKLPTVLDLSAAAALLETLQRQLRGQAPLRLDASGVETLTLPCVQVVLAALRSHDRIAIERPSEAFVSAFEDLGFDCAELFDANAIDPDAISIVPDPTGVAEPAPLQAQELPIAKRILTIDDSKTIRDMLMLTLADAGFEVLQAVDGQDGLDVLDREQVDLVITDINMPRMDGYEVIKKMRSNSAHMATPILVLTTESEADKKNLARVAGATGWMVKPFDPARLIETINKVAH